MLASLITSFIFFTGGAAEKAGLKVGDMVLKVNGQDVTQAAHSQVVKMAAAGNKSNVTITL